MAHPQVVNKFRHGNAERYDVVIDFAKYPIGRRVQLLNLGNKNNINFDQHRQGHGLRRRQQCHLTRHATPSPTC